MSSDRRRSWRLVLIGTLALTLCGSVACADGLGVVLAPAGDQVSEDEAVYAEALVAALVAEGQRAAYLHDGSPLVRASGVKLPAVGATDDWTPLSGALDRLATVMRLDYVLLTSLGTDDGETSAAGLLVVRGGEGVNLQEASDGGSRDVAARMAESVILNIPQLPAPDDSTDDTARPVMPPDGVEEDESPAPRPADPEQEAAADDAPPADEGRAPIVIADEPPADDDRADEPPADDDTAEEPQPEEGPTPDEQADGPEETDDALAEAEVAYEEGRLSDAEALLDVSLRETGASGAAYYLRARLSLAGRDRDAAIADLRRAVALDASLVEARVWLGRLLADQGLWQDARDHYEQAVEADPTHVEAVLGLARLYRDHGHRRKAVALLTEAIDRGQEAPGVLMLLAELHGRGGKVELAERYFVRAADAAEGEQEAVAWERLGDLYVELNRHPEALTCYVKAAEVSPSRTSMVERRYTEVMTAADGAVHEALTATWSAFEDYAESGIGQREMVYRRMSEMRTQLEEAMQFVESINPPGDLSARHIERQFAYSLAVEASVLALTWLDLGDDSMLGRAGEVHADAVAQFQWIGAED